MTGAFPGHAQTSVTFACHLLKLTKVVVSLSIWATYHFSIMGTICTHAISSRITFRVWWTYKSPANHSGDIHSFWKRKEIKRIILASITLLIIDPSNILTRARLVETRHETEYVPAKIGEYPSDLLQFSRMSNSKYNELYLARKYCRIFVRGHYKFWKVDSFARANRGYRCTSIHTLSEYHVINIFFFEMKPFILFAVVVYDR